MYVVYTLYIRLSVYINVAVGFWRFFKWNLPCKKKLVNWCEQTYTVLWTDFNVPVI